MVILQMIYLVRLVRKKLARRNECGVRILILPERAINPTQSQLLVELLSR